MVSHLQEHIGHLIVLETLHHNRILELQEGKEILTPADMSNAKTNAASYNDTSIIELLAQFVKVRTHFISDIRSLDETNLRHSAWHERLGRQMNPVDVCYFVAEHDGHHLAIVEHILELKI